MARNVREIALDVLRAMEKKGAWSDLQISHEIEKHQLDRRDAALLTGLVYGVLEHRSLCDWYIVHYTERPLGKLSPAVVDILRLSICQIVFLDKIPPHAAVAEGVELAKKRANPRAAGLVNAVLRRISSCRDELPEPPGKGSIPWLSVRYSHPEWFVRRMTERLGCAQAELLMQENGKRPPVVCRVNTLKTSVEELITRLETEGIQACRHAFLPDAVVCERMGDVRSLSSFKQGLWYVQDAASQLAVMALAPCPGREGIDLCAAPGGKSLLCAQLMNDQGKLRSFDLHLHRVQLIRENARRMGISMISSEVGDGTRRAEELLRSADFVLCDVPCSGTGVIRKKPEIRYKREEEALSLRKTQKELLENAAAYLKTGGEMIYSTCSVLKEENEEIVDEFLENHRDFRRIPFTLPGIGAVKNGEITLFPHLYGTDGFFIAKIGRVAE